MIQYDDMGHESMGWVYKACVLCVWKNEVYAGDAD